MEGSKKSAEWTWLESYEEVLHRASVRLENLYGRAIGLLEVDAAVGELVEELQRWRDDGAKIARWVLKAHSMVWGPDYTDVYEAAQRVLGEE